jgi:hypothetical protein
MANPFEVRVPSTFEALMALDKGYEAGKNWRSDRAVSAARQEAQSTLAQGGDTRGALAKLLGAGDIKGAAVLSQYQNNANSANTVYGTPIYGTTPDGKTAIGSFDKTGTFRPIDTGGFTPTPGGIRPLDIGSGYVPFDPRTGQVGGGPAYQPGRAAPQRPGIIPKTGEVPTGYAPQVGPGGITAAPIPGTPQAQKERDERQAAVTKDEQTAESGQSVKQFITDARKVVTSAPWYNPAVGMGASIGEQVGGSNATNLVQLTETIRGNIGFDRLQRMRDESPTGGALGQVAVQELNALQATLGSLSNAQSKAQFLTNLKRVEDQYDRIIKKAQAYPNAAKYGFAPAGRQAPQPQPASTPQGTRKSIGGRNYIQVNGQWFEE